MYMYINTYIQALCTQSGWGHDHLADLGPWNDRLQNMRKKSTTAKGAGRGKVQTPIGQELQQIPWHEVYRTMCSVFALPGIRHPKEEDTEGQVCAWSGISRAAAYAASKPRQLRHAALGRKDAVVNGRELASLVLFREGKAKRKDLVNIMCYRLDSINQEVPSVGGGFFCNTFNSTTKWQNTGKNGQWELNEAGREETVRLLVDIVCTFLP